MCSCGLCELPRSHPHDGLFHSTYQEILCPLPVCLSSSSLPCEALEGSLDLCLALSRCSASVYRVEGLITPGGKAVTHWVCSSLLDRLCLSLERLETGNVENTTWSLFSVWGTYQDTQCPSGVPENLKLIGGLCEHLLPSPGTRGCLMNLD